MNSRVSITMKTPRSKTLRRRRRASPLTVMTANNLYQQHLEEAPNNHLNSDTQSNDGSDHCIFSSRTEKAHESTLQAEFAERTAKEMKEILSWWESPPAQRPSEQQLALPRNTLVLHEVSSQQGTVEPLDESHGLNEDEESDLCADTTVQDSALHASCKESSFSSVPSIAMDSCVSEDSYFSDAIISRSKVSPVFSSPPDYSNSADDLHLFVQEQKFQVDQICSATNLLADCLVALTETSDDDCDDDVNSKASRRRCYHDLPLPPLRLQDRIHIWWYCQMKRFQEVAFVSIWNVLPLEFLTFWIFLTTYTSERTRRNAIFCLFVLLFPRLLFNIISAWASISSYEPARLVCYKSVSIPTIVESTAAVIFQFDEDVYLL